MKTLLDKPVWKVEYVHNGKTQTLKKGLKRNEADRFLQSQLNKSTYSYIDDKDFNEGLANEVRCGYFGKDQLDHIYRVTPEVKENDSISLVVIVNNYHVYRKFRSCDAMHKYVHAIIRKGYKAYAYIENGIRRIDEQNICDAVFGNGLLLRKDGKEIHISENKLKKTK